MATEEPPQDYYPSARVDLVLRLEEFGSGALAGSAPEKPAKNIVGIKDPARAPLVAQKDADAPEGVTRFILVPATPTGRGAGQAQESSKDNLTFPIRGLVPLHAEWKQTGFRNGDTLDLTLRWSDFPIHPLCIRSCAVEFFLGTLRGDEYARGLRGEVRQGLGGRNVGSPLNIIPDHYVDPLGRQRTNLRFQGWVDDDEIELGEDNDTVTFKCLDNTRLFIKQQASTRQVIAADKPIDEAVATYLGNYPQFDGITVEYRPTSEPRTATNPPRLKAILAGSAMRPQLGPPLAKGGASTGGEGFSVWDYLVDICGAIGHNIRVDGTTVIIQRVRDALESTRSEDPYVRRDLPSGSYPYRTFVYGRNVSKLKIKRQFARKEPSNIECRCYNPARKNVLVARFPTKADKIPRLISALPGDAKAEQKWTVVRVPSIYSTIEDLKKVAEDYYFQLNRQEIEISTATRNLASYGGGNEDPDLLDAKPGDAMELLINQALDFSSAATTEQKQNAEGLAVQSLVELGFATDFATAYARAKGAANRNSVYRLRDMGVTWDVSDGVSLAITMHNFIVARADTPPDVDLDAFEKSQGT